MGVRLARPSSRLEFGWRLHRLGPGSRETGGRREQEAAERTLLAVRYCAEGGVGLGQAPLFVPFEVTVS